MTEPEVWPDLHLDLQSSQHGYQWVGKQPHTSSESAAVISPFLNAKQPRPSRKLSLTFIKISEVLNVIIDGSANDHVPLQRALR